MLLILELRDSRSHDSTGLKFDDFSLMICIIQNYSRAQSEYYFGVPYDSDLIRFLELSLG